MRDDRYQSRLALDTELRLRVRDLPKRSATAGHLLLIREVFVTGAAYRAQTGSTKPSGARTPNRPPSYRTTRRQLGQRQQYAEGIFTPSRLLAKSCSDAAVRWHVLTDCTACGRVVRSLKLRQPGGAVLSFTDGSSSSRIWLDAQIAKKCRFSAASRDLRAKTANWCMLERDTTRQERRPGPIKHPG